VAIAAYVEAMVKALVEAVRASSVDFYPYAFNNYLYGSIVSILS
jgi:hypothetical protein